mmetsp:Transcript_152016/g.488060  ORF Transcript_152016/g.488060 Transcript_152016/m.488060 type:complete len:243 (+) Transcript_152016:3529-4257(+)
MNDLSNAVGQSLVGGGGELLQAHVAHGETEAVTLRDLLVESLIDEWRFRQNRWCRAIHLRGAPHQLDVIGLPGTRALHGRDAGADAGGAAQHRGLSLQRLDDWPRSVACSVVGAVELWCDGKSGILRKGLGDEPAAAALVADESHVPDHTVVGHVLQVLVALARRPHLQVRIPKLPSAVEVLLHGHAPCGVLRDALVDPSPRGDVVDVDTITRMLLEQDRSHGSGELLRGPIVDLEDPEALP